MSSSSYRASTPVVEFLRGFRRLPELFLPVLRGAHKIHLALGFIHCHHLAGAWRLVAIGKTPDLLGGGVLLGESVVRAGSNFTTLLGSCHELSPLQTNRGTQNVSSGPNSENPIPRSSWMHNRLNMSTSLCYGGQKKVGFLGK